MREMTDYEESAAHLQYLMQLSSYVFPKCVFTNAYYCCITLISNQNKKIDNAYQLFKP